MLEGGTPLSGFKPSTTYGPRRTKQLLEVSEECVGMSACVHLQKREFALEPRQ
jgi:hypothetical protein